MGRARRDVSRGSGRDQAAVVATSSMVPASARAPTIGSASAGVSVTVPALSESTFRSCPPPGCVTPNQSWEDAPKTTPSTGGLVCPSVGAASQRCTHVAEWSSAAEPEGCCPSGCDHFRGRIIGSNDIYVAHDVVAAGRDVDALRCAFARVLVRKSRDDGSVSPRSAVPVRAQFRIRGTSSTRRVGRLHSQPGHDFLLSTSARASSVRTRRARTKMLVRTG